MMKTRISLFFLLGLILIVWGTFKISSRNQQQQVAELENASDRGTIAWRVRVAKAKGERQVIMYAPIIDYAGSGNNTDDLLSNSNAVIAQPIWQKSYIFEDRQEIVTWYKFRIVENLSQKGLATCSTCSPSISPPEEAFPLNSDEFLIAKYGGTVVIDNVKVSTEDKRFPEFSISEKYLLFISLVPPGIAGTVGGPEAIFRVEPNGVIEAINDNPHPIKRDLEVKFKNSIQGFKEHLRNRHVSQ